jgi:hypothetical protein
MKKLIYIIYNTTKTNIKNKIIILNANKIQKRYNQPVYSDSLYFTRINTIF